VKSEENSRDSSRVEWTKRGRLYGENEGAAKERVERGKKRLLARGRRSSGGGSFEEEE
jgi:hypothetical protein